jgi:gluconolactonase
MGYDLANDGTIDRARPCAVRRDVARCNSGDGVVPTGMKVDWNGNLFATGPGGVLVIAPDGRHLGRTGRQSTAQCAFGHDGSTLYNDVGFAAFTHPAGDEGNGVLL